VPRRGGCENNKKKDEKEREGEEGLKGDVGSWLSCGSSPICTSFISLASPSVLVGSSGRICTPTVSYRAFLLSSKDAFARASRKRDAREGKGYARFACSPSEREVFIEKSVTCRTWFIARDDHGLFRVLSALGGQMKRQQEENM